jgi:hypothetical protein
MAYRNKKYLKWIAKQPSCSPDQTVGVFGQIVPAHQRKLLPCGTGTKPPDTTALPLQYAEHAAEHHYGDKTFWGNTDRGRLCVKHVCRYLDEVHNVDGWRKALELLTDYMEENKL